MSQPNDRMPPAWLIERLALGELDAAQAADVRRRLEAAGRSADETLAALAASNREILAAHPAPAAVEAIRRRAAAAARSASARVSTRWRGLLIAGPLAAAGVAVALLVVRPGGGTGPAPSTGAAPGLEETRVKGSAVSGDGPRLAVYRRKSAGVERLSDGARAVPGDLLQLAYANAGGAYGVLLSIDGAGQVTLHWPEKPTGQAPALAATAGEVKLPSSYELDDAPAFERFVLVTADRAFAVAPVVDAARALAARPAAARVAPLSVSGANRQSSLTLEKSSGGPR